MTVVHVVSVKFVASSTPVEKKLCTNIFPLQANRVVFDLVVSGLIQVCPFFVYI